MAEETGLIAPLGAWVIQQACSDAGNWPDEIKIAVNLSPAQFARENLAQIIINALAVSGVSPGRLELEITEEILLAQNYDNRAVLDRLCVNLEFRSSWTTLEKAIRPSIALIVLGGLQSLPPSVYEAAQIDGASPFRTFQRITLPLLLPTIVTATILRSVDLLRFFDIIYITTQGGPGNASNTLNIYGFRVGFEFFNIGYASALMLTLTAIVFGAVLAFNRLRGAVAW